MTGGMKVVGIEVVEFNGHSVRCLVSLLHMVWNLLNRLTIVGSSNDNPARI